MAEFIVKLFPEAVAFERWKHELRLALCVASGRGDEKAMEWAKDAERFNAVKAERLVDVDYRFAALDAIVVGCSTQAVAEQKRTLVVPRGLSYPFLSDVKGELADAFGASSDVGVRTLRQTFVIDPAGLLRWQEVNIDFGIGEFSIENHPRRVLREFSKVRNSDGWAV